jgi:hypothetical protein
LDFEDIATETITVDVLHKNFFEGNSSTSGFVSRVVDNAKVTQGTFKPLKWIDRQRMRMVTSAIFASIGWIQCSYSARQKTGYFLGSLTNPSYAIRFAFGSGCHSQREIFGHELAEETDLNVLL